MNRKNFYAGLGVGVAVCTLGTLVMRPKKRRTRCAVSKALMSMSELADSINNNMPW